MYIKYGKPLTSVEDGLTSPSEETCYV